MQRVQRGALHSQHASPGTINGGPRPLPCAAARHRPGHPAVGLQALQLGPWQQQQQRRRRQQRQQRLPFTCGAAAGSADAGGDPSIIPKARASTPVQPSAIDSPGSPTGGAGNSTGASPGSTGPPSSSSYSSYYKSQNTRFPSYPGSGAGVSGAGSGGAPTAPAGGSSSRHGSPTPAAAAAAAAASAAPAAAPTAADGAAAHAAAAAVPAPPPPEVSVDDALKKAQEALAAAQTSLEASSSRSGLQGVASAALARATAVWLAVRPAVIATTLAVAMVASHAFGLALQWAAATLSALGIAAWGHRRGSLTPSGAVAAATVGLATLGCSLRLGATLLAFFFANSRIAWLRRTRAAADISAGPVPGVSAPPPPPQRDWALVLANSGLPTLLAIGYGALAGCLDLPLGALPGIEPWRADLITLLMGGFLGYYAARCGDTWAGELGSLSPDTPWLVTTLKPVRPGTAGGVTLLGLSASLAGGLFVGAVFYLAAAISPTLWVFDLQRQAALAQWRLVPLGLMAGLVGSFLDSLIGATLRYTGWDVKAQRLVDRPGPDVVHISGLPLLPGAAVNVISASLTSVATALVALRMFA